MSLIRWLMYFACSALLVGAGWPAAAQSPAPAPAAPRASKAGDGPAEAPRLGALKLRKRTGDWAMWGGDVNRDMVSDETGIADDFDVASGRNVKWKAALGSQSYGNPVVAGGKVFVGTNNEGVRNPKITGDKGVVMCFREKDGEFLWQAVHNKLESGRVNDWPLQGICSSPCVVGDRVYYVSNRCELICADTEGFRDGENDGPFTEEAFKEPVDADFVWKLDMINELGVFPHNLATSSPVVLGDFIFVVTSNGVDEGHIDLPAPNAPSFLAVNRHTGKVIWERNDPLDKVLHGQWSCPALTEVNGVVQVIFPGGDGWLRGFDARTGELIWKYDCNPKDAKYILGGRGTRNEIIATPVVVEGRCYVGVGQDPEHGEGPGFFHCVDVTKTGDVTETGKVWSVGGKHFNRTISTAAVHDGLCYVSDLSGFLYCFDAKDGRLYWRHDLMSAVWGSPYCVDGKVYIGDEDGDLAILNAAREEKLIREVKTGDTVYTTPVVANGTLYVTTRSTLYAIGGK